MYAFNRKSEDARKLVEAKHLLSRQKDCTKAVENRENASRGQLRRKSNHLEAFRTG